MKATLARSGNSDAADYKPTFPSFGKAALRRRHVYSLADYPLNVGQVRGERHAFRVLRPCGKRTPVQLHANLQKRDRRLNRSGTISPNLAIQVFSHRD
jgi:hypothetical protein